MIQTIPVPVARDGRGDAATDSRLALANAFICALRAKDFDALERLFGSRVRFRAVVPSEEIVVGTARQAANLLRDWFEDKDVLLVVQSAIAPMADRLYVTYRLRVHGARGGWRVIEQHAFCHIYAGQIVDMWLLCSGFRPEPLQAAEAGDCHASGQPRWNMEL